MDREPTQRILLEHPRVAMVVRDEASYNAVRTPMDLPIVHEAIEAVKNARKDVVLLPTMGGSVPPMRTCACRICGTGWKR